MNVKDRLKGCNVELDGRESSVEGKMRDPQEDHQSRDEPIACPVHDFQERS
jgi:hypothetical protein